MPRKIWFRKSKGAWYTQFGRQQVKLAEGFDNKTEAQQAFNQLLAEDVQRLPRAHKLTVADICKAFLDHARGQLAPNTVDWYERFLGQFTRTFGCCIASRLKVANVSQWLEAQKRVPVGRAPKGQRRPYRVLKWSSSTRHSVVNCLRSTFNRAVRKRLLLNNPLADLERPAMESRDHLLAPEDRRAILTSVKDREFRIFLYALANTGARPGEIASVTAAHVDLTEGIWRLTKHKTAKRTGKPRTIVLIDPMKKLTARLMREHPEGPLFVNTKGQAFTCNAIRCRIRNIRERLGLGKKVVAYCYRHTFITEALARGVPVAKVAAVVGHTTYRMIEKHYDHLSQKYDDLRQAIVTAVSPPLGQTA